MKQPFWKRWLSYLFEFHIESAPSEDNPHLYVSLSKGRYQLCTENAIYSFGDLYDNFVKAFLRLDLDKLPGKDVLILGFGLGSIPIILEKKFGKKYDYVAVELDEEVLYLADKYTMPDIKSNIQFVQADAFVFTHLCQEKFDLICMDVFSDDIVPPDCETSDFMEKLKEMLNPEGVLLYNRLALSDRDKKESKYFFETEFVRTFPKGYALDVDGNWILVNEKRFVM